MRALMTLTVVMAVLIVAGTATVLVTLIHRASNPGAHIADRALEAPAGTRIAGIASYGHGLALLLQGGGADRVVLFDPATGRVEEALHAR